MKKLELTDRQFEVLISAMQCYTNDARADLEVEQDLHGTKDCLDKIRDRKSEIIDASAMLRVCHNILEKLQGDRYFY